MSVTVISKLAIQGGADSPIIDALAAAKGFAVVADTTERGTIKASVKLGGFLVYRIDLPGFEFWNGTSWVALNAGAGGGIGFRLTFSATTADADPGNGIFRASTASYASAGSYTLFVDLQEFGGTDITAWLDSLDDTSGGTKGIIRLQSLSDPTKWVEMLLTAWTTATGYRKLSVTYLAGPGGLLTTAGDTFFSFDAIGYTGTVPAASGGTGIAGAGGTANRFLRTSDGSTWSAQQVNAATDLTGVVPVPNGGSAPGVSGGNLTNANVTKSIADGTDFFLPTNTLGTSNKTVTLDRTTGTPQPGEKMRFFISSQAGFTYTIQNDNSAGGLTSAITVAAGEKWLIIAEYMGTDWLVQRDIRLA